METENIEMNDDPSVVPPTCEENPQKHQNSRTNVRALWIFIILFVTTIIFFFFTTTALTTTVSTTTEGYRYSEYDDELRKRKEEEEKRVAYTAIPISFSAIFFISFVINWIVNFLVRCSVSCFLWTVNIAIIFGALLASLIFFTKLSEEVIIFGIKGIWFGFGAIAAIIAGIGGLIFFRQALLLVSEVIKKSLEILSKFWILKILPFFTVMLIALPFYISYLLQFQKDNVFAEMGRFCMAVLFGFLVLECQNYIVTATITEWFYTKDETNIGQWSIIKSKIGCMFKYHLGSVCFGALTIPETILLKCFIKVMLKLDGSIGMKLAKFVLDRIVKFLANMGRSSYVLVSRDSKQFIESGRLIKKVEEGDVKNIATLRWYTYFIILNIQIIMLTPYSMLFVDLISIPMEFVLLVGFIFSAVFFSIASVLEATADTILVCIALSSQENNNDEPEPNPNVKQLIEDYKEIKNQNTENQDVKAADQADTPDV